MTEFQKIVRAAQEAKSDPNIEPVVTEAKELSVMQAVAEGFGCATQDIVIVILKNGEERLFTCRSLDDVITTLTGFVAD